MLDFSESYFKDEIRSGFFVPEMMKRSWAAHLKILDELKILFEKYNLTYYADFGTLLGAVRHKGIIPWDDDIDISMPRKDYMTLLNHAHEIGDGLCIRSIYSSRKFTNFHAVATNDTSTLEWDESRMKDYYGCPFICYIDIFPMDYIYRDKKKYQIQKELYYLAYKMVFDCVELEDKIFGSKLCTLSDIEGRLKYGDVSDSDRKLLKHFLDGLESLRMHMRKHLPGRMNIDREKQLRNQLCLITDKVARMCDERDADKVDYCPHMAYTTKKLWRNKNWVSETMDIPFESTSIAVPRYYENVLISRFGENYMTPVHEPSTHEYPFYRTQLEVLINGDTGELCNGVELRTSILEMIDTLSEAHELFEKSIGAHDYGASLYKIGELQSFAIQIGTAIENEKGEGTLLVKPLEEYCERLYEIYTLIEVAVNNADHNSQAGKTLNENEVSNMATEAAGLIDDARQSVITDFGADIPDDWKGRMTRQDGSCKKAVIYGLSAIELLGHGSESNEKLRRVVNVIEDNRDNIFLLLCLPEGYDGFMEKCRLDAEEGYDEIMKWCSEQDFIAMPSEKELDAAIEISSAYYGDECPLYEKYRKTGKPIMIQDYWL